MTRRSALLLLLRRPWRAFAADAHVTLSGLASLTAAAILEERNRQQTVTLSSQLAHLEEQHRTMAERLNYAEAGMLQAARLAAVGQLAASVAHEINNPLYAARNSLYLLEEDLPRRRRVAVSHDGQGAARPDRRGSSSACAISIGPTRGELARSTSINCWRRRWRWRPQPAPGRDPHDLGRRRICRTCSATPIRSARSSSTWC